MLKLWEWLSGKKLAIGGVALFIADIFIGDLLFTRLAISAIWLVKIQIICQWLGALLVPVGAIHKGIKHFQLKKAA